VRKKRERNGQTRGIEQQAKMKKKKKRKGR
jgi:hypothetical protein